MSHNIIFDGKIFTLQHNTIAYSPYLNGLINSGIGYDKDHDGNIKFESDDYTLEQFGCYIDHCNTGYINKDAFNIELFDFMGHCTIYHEYVDYLIFRLQYQWTLHTNLSVIYNAGKYKLGNNHKLKAIIKSLDNISKDGKYVIQIGKNEDEKVIMFQLNHSNINININILQKHDYKYKDKKVTMDIKQDSTDPITYMSNNAGKYYHKGDLYIHTTLDSMSQLLNNCIYTDIYLPWSKTTMTTKFPQLKHHAIHAYSRSLQPFLKEYTVKPAENIILNKDILEQYEGIDMLCALKLINIINNGQGSRCGTVKIKKANTTALYLLDAMELNFTVDRVIEQKYDSIIDMLSDFQLEM